MADLPTEFWGGWIAVITISSLLGLAWLVFSIYFSANGNDDSDSPVWDETLSEGNNPAPMWWFWLIFVSMIASVTYLMLYPGLGRFDGMLKWSQGGRLSDSTSVYHERFAQDRQDVIDSSIVDLQDDDTAMESARRIFDQNCSACHGPNGEGQAASFPNLIDSDWQWGGEPSQVEQSIRSGRRAAMVAWEPVIGIQGVERVAKYVMSLSGAEPKDAAHDDGKNLFLQFCAACHGPTGTGVAALGGPNLADEIWLYGGSETDIQHSIAAGRAGEMPAFAERLDDVQIKLLTAWLTRQE